MSGKVGQTSVLPREIPDRYRLKGLTRLDGRCRSARELKARRQAFAADPAAYLQASRRDRFLELESWLRRKGAVVAQGEPVDDSAYLAAMNTYLGIVRQLEVAARDGYDQDLASAIQAALHRENEQ